MNYHTLLTAMKVSTVFIGLVAVIAVSLFVNEIILRKSGLHNLPSFQVWLFRNASITRYAQVNEKTSSMFFKILYFNPPLYVTIRNVTDKVDFNLCPIKNCQLTTNTSLVSRSDVVIFDGQMLNKRLPRPKGQIWIFSGHESPVHYSRGIWRNDLNKEWNLTMTYDQQFSDIYWPYGVIRERLSPEMKNWTEIFYNKTKDVLIINSHCNTHSKRELIVQALKKYINVETLGDCGTKWKCGKHYLHDGCFSIINQYKFYLSFENSLCRGYFTEKLFENYDYDTIMVVRGGIKGEAARKFPKGTIVSTDAFDSVSELGKYLKRLSTSVTEYTKMLERKSLYGYIGYQEVFQETMCRVCEKLNNMNGTHTIPDIVKQVYDSKPCGLPSDLKNL